MEHYEEKGFDKMKKKLAVCAMLALTTFCLASCAEKNEGTTASEGFEPKLDTKTEETIDIAGFMGNFESLDQVINEFNEIYPNVTFSYDHNAPYMLAEYLENNQNIDIFMTDDQNLTQPDLKDNYVADHCLDLSGTSIDLSGLRTEAVKASTIDGQVLTMPIMQNTFGLVVNKTLLKEEGLEVPETYPQFLETLAKLKKSGYIPLQGSEKHLYAELVMNMAMNLLGNDPELLENCKQGDGQAVRALVPVFERLQEIVDQGYTDYKTNCTYPEDNYDGSIMTFFEGKVPFYVCNAECVSGMKKRESKSEAFTEHPFEYEFLYAPIGEEGAYAYTQPWYGFAISKDSDSKEMSEEFLRFMAQSDKLQEMAQTKGLPTVAADRTTELYQGLQDADNIVSTYVNDGSLPSGIRDILTSVCNDFGAGKYKSAEEAAREVVSAIKK